MSDAHASFRAEVECYTAADPMPAMENLSVLTGVGVDRLIRYVLVKYAASASDALLTLEPIVFQQMNDCVAQAETEGTDAARLKAYASLKQIIDWLSLNQS